MAEKCSVCGQEKKYPNIVEFRGKAVCKDCVKEIKEKEAAGKGVNENAVTQQQSTGPEQSTFPTTIDTRFKTLLGYGKFLSSVGWFIIIIGIIAIFGGIVSGAEGDEIGFGIAMGAVVVIILGIGMVASGQLISCFVAIEKNTRSTYELIQKAQK